jgi:pyruvate-formate lyase
LKIRHNSISASETDAARRFAPEGDPNMPAAAASTISYSERIEALRTAKRAQTLEKQAVRGAMDYDDHGIVLPPEGTRHVVHSMSGSGISITDVIMTTFKPVANHPSGEFFGPRACGENFRKLLELHPTYIEPESSLAGGYMVNFMSYRKLGWKPELDCPELLAEHEKYHTVPAVGACQHMCQDLEVGLRLGWGGLLLKIQQGARNNPQASEFYAGLENVVFGMKNWISRHAAAAHKLAVSRPELRENLLAMAAINERLVTEPPQTFHEACQWILWYQLAARMYNGSGSLGKLDVLLQPFYEADTKSGLLTDEEATFHIACLLLRDTSYLQLGGPDATGKDVTSTVSYLVLEAAHWLRIPANVAVAVGKDVDAGLLRRGVEILLEDRDGMPKFLGVDNTISGFVAAGFPLESARDRAYAGCHWSAVPGREYASMDVIKLSFPRLFDVALREMLVDSSAQPSVSELWNHFKLHMQSAIHTVGIGIDYQYEHMHEVFPELVLDLLCHGPIEKGLDASNGGVEYYTYGVDGAGLATAADSFAALEERIELQRRLTWPELLAHLDADWVGPEGEKARLTMKTAGRFGNGSSLGDEWAGRIAQTFSAEVRSHRTPMGLMMIPGIFSWALNIQFGRKLGATPNGRHAGEPISHGASPDPGFRRDGAATAMAVAVAKVQCGYGNTAPMQIDLDPSLSNTPEGVDKVAALIRGHFDLGGTQININILNKDQLIEAHRNPSLFPDLVVRVTGFSVYFSSLSPDMRKLVVDRLICN